MEKKPLRQTTVRLDPDLLRKARFYLDEEGLSVNEFLTLSLERYVHEREKAASKPKE